MGVHVVKYNKFTQYGLKKALFESYSASKLYVVDL